MTEWEEQRRRPGRQVCRPQFPHSSSTRVEEDQAGLAGSELHDREGHPDPASIDTGHPFGTRTAVPRPIGGVS